MNCRVITVTLISNAETLERNLIKDIPSGLRTTDIIERSTAKLPMYETLNTIKIDISDKNIDEISEKIKEL